MVCVGDGRDDGKAKPNGGGWAGGPRRELLERFEQSRDLRGGNRPADGVRDEVADEAFDQGSIADRARAPECQLCGDLPKVVALNHLGHDRPELDCLAAPCLAPGEGEAGLEQPLLLQAGAEDVLADLSPGSRVRGLVREDQLEEGPLSCSSDSRPPSRRSVALSPTPPTSFEPH